MDAFAAQTSSDRRLTSSSNPRGMIACTFVLAGILCLCIDVPLAFFFEAKHEQLPKFLDGFLRDSLGVCESFGHGFGAILIIVAIAVLAPHMQKLLPWVVAGSLGSGMVANAIKMLVYRTRPRKFIFESGTVWTSFTEATSGGMDVQSFPSAHTATALGLAVMLSSLFPRGRWYFFILAFLVGMQRIVSSAHFPSDVFAGAAVGWLVSTICVNAMIKMNSHQESTPQKS